MGNVEDRALRVLIVEDSEDDALLLLQQLRRGGYVPEMHRVEDAVTMEAALKQRRWDLIIADHNLPGFDSQRALKLAKRYDANTPFILVSGSVGEEVAVDAMKSGAHDYVMKHNLARLLPAIERELREADNRRAHQRAEATIRHLAFHDHLTGVVNRARFESLLDETLKSAREGDTHALLYLDLDQFKIVNDTCGHLAGDELLKRLCQKIKLKIRASDVFARLGGDEFAILLKHCPPERAAQVAQELFNSLVSWRFLWGERTFKVGTSIGVVPIKGGDDSQTLLTLADMACYAAKDRGGNRIHIYTEGDRDILQRRGEMHWLQRIQLAMSSGGLLLYQQQIQALQGGESHCELLL
ncbi:MAG TPA: diguanylate cyclase, partial [Gammaproteobacteria bacterium]|nr:diguanylate cyclase [Gammaproteobacteria bacterium]